MRIRNGRAADSNSSLFVSFVSTNFQLVDNADGFWFCASGAVMDLLHTGFIRRETLRRDAFWITSAACSGKGQTYFIVFRKINYKIRSVRMKREDYALTYTLLKYLYA